MKNQHDHLFFPKILYMREGFGILHNRLEYVVAASLENPTRMIVFYFLASGVLYNSWLLNKQVYCMLILMSSVRISKYEKLFIFPWQFVLWEREFN